MPVTATTGAKLKSTVGHKVSGNSQAEEAANNVIPSPKRLRVEQLSGFKDQDASEHVPETQTQATRHSSRAGKGHRGAVQQLPKIKHVLVARPSRQAAWNLYVATEGQEVNPMAPSYTLAQDDEESQIPLWVVSSTPLTQVQLAFMLSQSDQCFGFSLHSWTTSAATSLTTAPKPLSTGSWAPSSCSSSLFPAGMLCTVSTPPTSHTPSERGSNNSHSNRIDSQAGRLVSQLGMLVKATQPKGISLIQDQEPAEEVPHSLPPRRIGLCQTGSFHPKASTLPRLHTMSSTGVVHQSQDDDGSTGLLEIDEASPDEDKCSAISELQTPLSARSLVAPAIAGPPHETHPPPPGSGIIQDNVDPSQLHFYPPPIRNIIAHAKQLSHSNLASVNSFLLRQQFNIKAVEYMDEGMAKRINQGLTIPEGWWPECTDGITKLLWEDIGNRQSSLKKKVCSFVRQSYEWDQQNHCPANAEIARQLLDQGSFLMHGIDEEGRMNNLAHPVLVGLIVDFFYTGTNAVANLFPDIFRSEVPHPAVALAATAIKVALDEIVTDGKEVAFKRDVYADVYTDILGLMSKCNTAPIHRAKTKALHEQWARRGRFVVGFIRI
ncbi:hypothetical protein JVU11DRAFT_4480 [Chiua virens]|nr:hypothetical protein JVU11DRAFT_4480 [Chiua virens]